MRNEGLALGYGATEGTAQPLLTRLGPNAAVSDRPGPLERNG